MVPIEDYPVMWMIPRFDLPGSLRPPGYVSTGNPAPWSTAINFDHEKLAKHGITNFTTNQMDVFAYVRMIAKIGHALAASRYGLNHFIPFLRHIILHQTGPEAFEFIGGRPEQPHDTEELHGLMLRTLRVGTRILLVAEIRLFATLGALSIWRSWRTEKLTQASTARWHRAVPMSACGLRCRSKASR